MSLGKPCEKHNIPETVCVACVAAKEERELLLSDPHLYARLREIWLLSKLMRGN